MLATLPPCPVQARSNSPLSVSQRLTVPLALPLASKRPAGSKATLATSLRCHSNALRRHSKVRSNLPSVVSQSDTVPSREPPASLPSPGSKATHLTARWFQSSARTTPTPGGTLAARGPPLLLGIAVSLAFSRWGPRDKIVNGSKDRKST